MSIDNKILEEIKRYNNINRYIMEQDVPPPPAEDPAAALPPPPGDPAAGAALPPPPGDPAAAGAPPAPPAAAAEPQPVDVEADPDVEKVGGEKDKGSKELEITDLVKSQQNVEKKQEEYFDNLFKHLEDLESKLGNMDSIVSKLNDLEMKVEKYRPKTPEEKLELRSLDSGPFNQKLSQFFDDKQEELEKTGKNDYVLTSDEVEGYSPNEIKKSFRNFDDENENGIQDFKQIR
jgi:hypothetical protein